MNYFVTGATGFIGRFLVARLLKREGARVFALVRPGSEYKLDAMRRRLCVEESRLVPITGDLTKKLLGVSKRDQDAAGKPGGAEAPHDTRPAASLPLGLAPDEGREAAARRRRRPAR